MILDTWHAASTARLPDLLAADAVFSSPVADYHGRERASHLLGLIVDVIEHVEPTAEWGAAGDSVSAFIASVDGARLEGIVRERRDAAGKVTHVTLFLRPFAELRTAIARMRALLETNPLPDCSS